MLPRPPDRRYAVAFWDDGADREVVAGRSKAADKALSAALDAAVGTAGNLALYAACCKAEGVPFPIDPVTPTGITATRRRGRRSIRLSWTNVVHTNTTLRVWATDHVVSDGDHGKMVKHVPATPDATSVYIDKETICAGACLPCGSRRRGPGPAGGRCLCRAPRSLAAARGGRAVRARAAIFAAIRAGHSLCHTRTMWNQSCQGCRGISRRGVVSPNSQCASQACGASEGAPRSTMTNALPFLCL